MTVNRIRSLPVVMAVSLSLGAVPLLPVASAHAADSDLARRGFVTASSTQSDQDGTFPAFKVKDGDPDTRWASGNGPDDGAAVFTADLMVDLGAIATITSVDLAWEAAYAEAYDIEVASTSPDEPGSWETVFTTGDGDGDDDTIALDAIDARYVRINMLERGAVLWDAPTLHYYGYSLHTLAVIGGFEGATTVPTGVGDGAGDSTVRHDFESGIPGDFFAWGSTGAVTPTLDSVGDHTVPGAGADNQVLVATVGGSPTGDDWFGFTQDTPPTDWSDHDGFRFWFLGSGSGETLRFELKNEGRLFEDSLVDDAAGWRRVSVLFSDLRVKEDAGSDERFNPEASTGFAVTLSGLGAGSFRMDDFALFQRLVVLDDFEDEIEVGSRQYPIGYHVWSNAANNATLSREIQERDGNVDNHILTGTHLVPRGSYGGMGFNVIDAQDWSGFNGIRFLWYSSQETYPGSPTGGSDIVFTIDAGGPSVWNSEKWQATFKDSWGSSTSRWKLVELPFSAFVPYDPSFFPGRGSHPVAEQPLSGTLDLDRAWGYGFIFGSGDADHVRWVVDDVGLYGTPPASGAGTESAVDDQS